MSAQGDTIAHYEDSFPLSHFVQNGEGIRKIVDTIFGQNAPEQTHLDTRVKRIFDKARPAESGHSLKSAMDKLEADMQLSPAARAEIEDLLDRTIRDNIGIIVDDVFRQEPTALITDTDYDQRHYLGVRVHFKSISPTAATRMKAAFTDNLGANLFEGPSVIADSGPVAVVDGETPVAGR